MNTIRPKKTPVLPVTPTKKVGTGRNFFINIVTATVSLSLENWSGTRPEKNIYVIESKILFLDTQHFSMDGRQPEAKEFVRPYTRKIANLSILRRRSQTVNCF